MTRLLALLAAVLVLTCASCGSETTDTSDDGASAEAPTQSNIEQPSIAPTDPPTDDPTLTAVEVLFDRPWVVEEGVWFLTARGYPRFKKAGLTSGLLNSSEPGSVIINGPALYGKYAVRVEAHPERPRVPRWCQDVVEVSLRVKRAVSMGSFETFSRSWRLPLGDYRVRYCATELDLASRETAEDEFDGDDYRLYSGRHLFQLWQAPPAPDRVIRVGSEFAVSQTSG